MMDQDKVQVIDFKLIGKKEQCIELKCRRFDFDIEFQLFVDGKMIEYEMHRVNTYDFILKTKPMGIKKNVSAFLIDESGQTVSFFNYEVSSVFLSLDRVVIFINEKINKSIDLLGLVRKAIQIIWTRHHFIVPIRLWKKYFKALKSWLGLSYDSDFFQLGDRKAYDQWFREKAQSEDSKALQYQPKVSFIIPVHNVAKIYLIECVESILCQSYTNIEICIVDDASTKSETLEILRSYEKDPRIKIKHRTQNGNISAASNDALTLVTGEFVALMDNDDTIELNACYEIVKVLNEDPELDFIYTDEDKLELSGAYSDPHFKPDFSPSTLLSMNYISHLTVLRKSLIDAVGGFTIGLEGSQDYDLYLKIIEKTNRIHHIPKVLYHWRKIPGSTAVSLTNKSYAIEAGRTAIENHLKRLGKSAVVYNKQSFNIYFVQYILEQEPSVSIIIPTQDNASLLEACLQSIFTLTNYQNYEVIVVNNDSVEEKTVQLFEAYTKQYQNFKIMRSDEKFNDAKLKNFAASKCTSEFLLFLDSDTRIISENWLRDMVGYGEQDYIGAVGAKLLYEDDTVQHCGFVLGIRGVARHVFQTHHRDDFGAYGRLAVPYNYAAVSEACLLVSRVKFESVSGFDENLSTLYIDVDFCLKLLDKGYYNVVLPEALLYHLESKSTEPDVTVAQYSDNKYEEDYMNKKWFHRIKNDPFYNPNLSRKHWFVLDRQKEDIH